ncbi:hypothetical protein CO661_01715 [Sinorhizobium fredii]|uniref:DUF1127 domain-containing protein n=1 Tax=Rhizobium fredii TaxID=380 RepID=A0A2A6M786_RHIFR|nr:hypothetical protein CO661_01715 [Sinorhizobium fredii]
MSYTEARTENRASDQRLLKVALRKLPTIVAAFTEWRRATARRRAMEVLTSDQLEDIGYSETPRPMLVVKAGLITNLMSMR